MKLHYERFESTPHTHANPGSKPVLIILHGLFGSGENWKSVARRLSAHYTCYCLDMRNHGQSPHDNDIGHNAMAGDVLEFIDAHKLHRPVLLGHSMGGKVAMTIAFSRPEIIGALIIVDIAPRKYYLNFTGILRAMKTLDVSTLHTYAQADEALTAGIPDNLLRYFIMKNLTKTKEGGFKWKVNVCALADNIVVLGNEPEPDNTVYQGKTLFIYGAKSGFVKDTDFDLLKNRFSEIRFSCIADAGHWVHADNTDSFVKAVAEFAESVS